MNNSLTPVATGGRVLALDSFGQTMTVAIPAMPIIKPAVTKPGICELINFAPINVPTEVPTVVPAENNADVVARIVSGTRSDNVAMAGAIIIFNPIMLKQ